MTFNTKIAYENGQKDEILKTIQGLPIRDFLVDNKKEKYEIGIGYTDLEISKDGKTTLLSRTDWYHPQKAEMSYDELVTFLADSVVNTTEDKQLVELKYFWLKNDFATFLKTSDLSYKYIAKSKELFSTFINDWADSVNDFHKASAVKQNTITFFLEKHNASDSEVIGATELSIDFSQLLNNKKGFIGAFHTWDMYASLPSGTANLPLTRADVHKIIANTSFDNDQKLLLNNCLTSQRLLAYVLKNSLDNCLYDNAVLDAVKTFLEKITFEEELDSLTIDVDAKAEPETVTNEIESTEPAPKKIKKQTSKKKAKKATKKAHKKQIVDEVKETDDWANEVDEHAEADNQTDADALDADHNELTD